MKKLILFLAIVFSLSNLEAQTVSEENITFIGGFYSNTTAMLSFSGGMVTEQFVFQVPNSVKNIYNDNDRIKIYPNPATVNITIETPQKARIDIINIEGQVLKSIIAVEQLTNINISDFAIGMYFVRITYEETISCQKFIKKSPF